MMIKILTRHISKTILTATGLVALVVMGVVFLMTLLGELKSLGVGDYGLLSAVLYVLYRLPSLLYQFSPLLILLGTMTGLSILSSHRELAVMRTAGFSIGQIIMSALCAAFLLILLFTAVGEWLAPGFSYTAEVRKENARNEGQSVVTAAGIWFHVGHNFIHVQHVIGRQLLEGVTRYQFDENHQLLAAYFAKKLTLQDGKWMMHDVVKTNFYPDRTVSKSMLLAPWHLKFNQSLLNIGLFEPSEMSLPKLAKFIFYLQQNGLQVAMYQYEYWQRMLQPLASIIMVFLAIPFVLGVMTTSTLGWRLIVGVMVGFGFFISNAFLGQLSIVYQLPALLAASLPLLFFALIGLLLSCRIR